MEKWSLKTIDNVYTLLVNPCQLGPGLDDSAVKLVKPGKLAWEQNACACGVGVNIDPDASAYTGVVLHQELCVYSSCKPVQRNKRNKAVLSSRCEGPA